MPEYLAPGVYVEEVSSGNKPIQAASTSTAGMVGLTARGPVNTPTLVTSQGQFNRVFGGKLDHNDSDSHAKHLDALPYAVDGFFKNGGSRAYITRIVGDAARRANTTVYSQDMAGAQTFTTVGGIVAGATTFVLNSVTGGLLNPSDTLLFSQSSKSDLVSVQSVTRNGLVLNHGLDTALNFDSSNPDTVSVCGVVLGVPNTNSDNTVDAVADDVLTPAIVAAWALVEDGVYYIQNNNDDSKSEYITVIADPADTDASDGTDLIISENGGKFLFSHAGAGTAIIPATITLPSTLDVGIDADAGATNVFISSTIAGTEALIKTADNEFYIVTGYSNALTLSAGAAFANAYAAGTPVTQVGAANFNAWGIYPGAWGNDLRVSTLAKNVLTTTMAKTTETTDLDIDLNSVFGVQQGSYLQFTASDGSVVTKKVSSVDRTKVQVTLTADIGKEVLADSTVKSLEFDLIVERFEGDTVVESERFDNLALDSAHSNFAGTVVGTYNDTTKDISASGESELIRLSDFTNGLLPLAKVSFKLAKGDDKLSAFNDEIAADKLYIGESSDDPGDRTGIQAMMNESNISLVAVPGRTSVTLQKALIAHCTKMRYRFAVLDCEQGAKLAEVQVHRQNYDTTYAAYYYPWLSIADPFGVKGDELNIAPSGHMLGVYARTDVQRGVHKAPANEVVKSILNFETRLTKGEQDILNPININCFRDFRSENRGLRIYGARTLSSDPQWRYVNVRRLFLFLEQSVDTSMQLAVFEPNAEPLWATVKRSLVNFLTTVWRSGALEGVTQDEAFYVNIGLDTMSQTDIDNGRLIVEIGVAPVKPAEFVIFRFSQKTREAQG